MTKNIAFNVNAIIGWCIWVLFFGFAAVRFRLDQNRPVFQKRGWLSDIRKENQDD